jgi:hypothetical protein
MAILDNQLRMSSQQASIRAAATYYSTNVIDLHSVGSANMKAKGVQLGQQDTFWLRAMVKTAFLGGTSVDFQIVAADGPWTDTAGAGASGVVQLYATGAIAQATLAANYRVLDYLLPTKFTKRYLGIRFVGVGIFTAGDVDVWVDSFKEQGFPL